MGNLSISSQSLSSGSYGPLATRSSMIRALMRSAAGGDTTDMPRVARWWEGRRSLPQGQDDAGSAARPPTPPQLALTCLRQTHRQGSPNARASGGSWEVGGEKRPPPPGRKITGKGRQWVPRKQGGEDREAVHRAALVQSPEPGPISPLPEGPRATLQPTRGPRGAPVPGGGASAPGTSASANCLTTAGTAAL